MQGLLIQYMTAPPLDNVMWQDGITYSLHIVVYSTCKNLPDREEAILRQLYMYSIV